jgi:hypothetical protein
MTKTEQTGKVHHKAILTREEVREIRKGLDQGDTLVGLAALYGVTAATISNIRDWKTWRHV